MNPPSALHGAMSRERKPFTYTPGGLDLSEIKSERMAKRLMRNAMNQGVPEVPIQQVQSPPATSNPIMVPNFNCLPVQVFPTINLPANPKSLLRTRSNPDPRDAPVQRVPPPQHNQFSKPSRPDKPEPLYTTTNNNNFSLPKPVPASTYTPISNNLNNQKQEQPAQIYSPINNNSSYQRPVSMFEYNTEQNNVNTLPQMNYGRSEPSPLLPEISYEAEYFQAPPRNVANKTVVPEYQYNKSIASENSTSADVDTKMKNRTENDNLFQPPTSNGFGAVIAQLECKNENKPYMLHGVPDPGNKQKDNVMQSFTIPNLDISVKSEIIEEDTTRQPHSSSAFKIPDIDISLKTEIVVPRKVEVPESFDIPSAAIVIKPKQDMTYDSIKISDNLQPEEATTNDNPVDLDFSIQPISIARIPSPFEKAVKEESRSDDEQKVVKVVKKQVKKESNSEIQNGNQNGDQEAQMTVKLPSKKSAAKTETNVEVVKKHLPDGSIEEVKTTTTKTTIDGKTTISTKTETTIIPKEEEEEVEVEEEEEEEEDENGVVEVVEENGDDEAVEEVVVIKKSPIVENGHKIVTKEENSETIVTKKVAVVQKQESEAEEEEEEEEEVEEEEVKPEEKPAKASPKEEVKEEQEEEEEVEEEEVVEEKVEVKKQEEDVEEEEVVEEEEKAVVEETKEEKPEQPKESAEEEEIEEEYEEVEEEKIEESQLSKEIESVETEKEIESEKEDEPKEDEAPKPAPQEDKEESDEKEVIKEEISKEPEEEKQDTKPEPQPAPKPEPSVPLREPSIPLEKVEDVEIKPIGLSSSETVSKSHTENTEIITSNERPSGPLSTQTEYKRIENIVSVNRTTKTLDHSYEQLTQQGVPTVKTYFVPPTLDRISTSPQPARPYQPVYSPSVDKPQERRHSLLLERLSMERQMPSSDIYQNNYQHNNASFEQQRQYSQEPQAEVLTVSNVKPSMITNSQWYQQQQQQQVKKENVIYNNVSSPAPPPAVNQSWSQPQPTQPPSQPQYQPPPQPQYQPPVQPQYQPAYSENINQDRSSSVYQQSAYQPYTPKPATWNPSSDSLSNAQNSQQNQYSLLNQSSTESYQKSTQQYSSGYVPPPWEQDSSYVADVSNQAQNFYQPPPASSTFSPGSNQGWKPTLPKSKFSKPPPTAYIPPAPNQSFVRAANAAEPPRPSPGKKTYYSEYERRYITVPESNYIPGENKYQPQPDPSPQYYYDNNEPSETVEPQWRKELREFTEKSSTQVNEQTSVRPPWEEDPKYVKPPSTVMYTATPTWSQTLRPRSWRERSFESEYVGSQEVSKTSTLGRGRPLSTYAKNSVDAIPERPRGVSVDRYNPNSYQAPIAAEHPPVQTHTLNVVPPAKSYHNPNVPAYHAQSRASAEPREQHIYPQARNWGESRASPIQSRSFKYLQWITGTDE